jgi:DNA polymerase/3'-5' exonuclease PolX
MIAEPVHLEVAQRVAEALCGELGPAFDRLEVAGSVRRRKGLVRDLELVGISRTTSRVEQVTLFQHREWQSTDAWDALEAMRLDGRLLPISPKSSEPEEDLHWSEKRTGYRYLKVFLVKPKLKVDLFLADPDTWGLIYTIRTGSSDFSRNLVMHWSTLSGGGRAKDGRLHPSPRTGPGGQLIPVQPIATPEEADVFRACRLSWVDPPLRQADLPHDGPLDCHHRSFRYGCEDCETWAETAWGIA